MARNPDIPLRQQIAELLSIAKQAAGGNPGKLQAKFEGQQGFELTPLEGMTRRSQLLDFYRQVAPQWAGGYDPGYVATVNEFRKGGGNEILRDETMQVGDYPSVDRLNDPARQDERTEAGERARKGAQFAGALFGDLASQGLQNIWWFVNAPQALAMLATQTAMHGSLGGNRLLKQQPLPGAPRGAPLTDGTLRVAAAMPAILGVSAASGSLFRLPGYAAAVPDEEDKTQTADPVSEFFVRSFMGRGGQLLPWEEFRQERPDVTKSEYEAYKAFINGNKSPLKFTDEGIHGPEVNFMGKSIPLATGVLPLLAGAVGAGVGTRMAGRRLAHHMGANRFVELRNLKDSYYATVGQRNKLAAEIEAAREAGRNPRAVEAMEQKMQGLEEELRLTAKEHYKRYNDVRGTIMTGALTGGTLGMGVTAAGAQLLQTLARAEDAERNRQLGSIIDAVRDESSGIEVPPRGKNSEERKKMAEEADKIAEEAVNVYNL